MHEQKAVVERAERSLFGFWWTMRDCIGTMGSADVRDPTMELRVP
jgi:hypothetical protein